MKAKSICLTTILLGILLCFATYTKAQGYEMKEGEVITIDRDGRLLNTNMPPSAKTKFNPGTSMQQKSDKPESIYNDDGTPKIPGYKPTGNAEIDAQNYRKAKYLFYSKDPNGYDNWVKKYSIPPRVQDVKLDEFVRMPEEKKQQIISQPNKYRIVKNTQNQE